MKKSFYLLSSGILLCSCSEPTDVVTGHARILLSNSAPVVTTAATSLTLAPAQQPKVEAPVVQAPPAEAVAETTSQEQEEPAKTTLFTQNQPEVKQPAPPVEITEIQAPTPEVNPAAEITTSVPENMVQKKEEAEAKISPVAQNQPTVSTPAPAEQEKPAVSQNQPVITPPALEAAEKPQVSTPAPVTVKPRVSQNQPATTAPRGVNYRNITTGQPVKRKYPIMPGQNRGLRNR